MEIDFSKTDYMYISDFYENDVMKSLISLSGIESNEEIEKNVEEALSQLRAMSQNEYNNDFWRTLLYLLYSINDRVESGYFDEVED